MENINPNQHPTPNAAAVQHVTKASSDQLLTKFAELGSQSNRKSTINQKLTLAKRRKQRGKYVHGSSPAALVERKSLLQPVGSRSLTLRAKEFKNKSIIATIEKTWRRTIEGASKIFVEKHYKSHKRLINDVY